MKKPLKKTTSKALSKSSKKIKKSLKPLRSLKKAVHKVKAAISSQRSHSEPAFLGVAAANKEIFSYQKPAGFELPSAYGKDFLVLLIRDPWWIYAYWEVTPSRENRVFSEIRRQGLAHEKRMLRVYDVTGKSMDSPNQFFDIELDASAGNWYIEAGKPDTEWIVELGIRATGGRFFTLIRSNRVKTPPFGISNVLDEEWMMPDDLYWKLFGLSTGFADLKSSLSLREALERYLRGIVSSSKT